MWEGDIFARCFMSSLGCRPVALRRIVTCVSCRARLASRDSEPKRISERARVESCSLRGLPLCTANSLIDFHAKCDGRTHKQSLWRREATQFFFLFFFFTFSCVFSVVIPPFAARCHQGAQLCIILSTARWYSRGSLRSTVSLTRRFCCSSHRNLRFSVAGSIE